MKRLFFSFSVGDDAASRGFVRELFARLQQQDIDAWIFESPRGEIKTGASISDACRRKIEEADIFVVFIDDRALQSDYVDIEVSHALWESGRRPLPIVPLVATQTPQGRWPVALAEATAFKGLRLRAPLLDDLERVVVYLCDSLALDYAPPKPQAPRLPLRQRLADELRGRAAVTDFGAGEFTAILRRCDLAVDAMGAEDYSRVKRLLESILTTLELDYDLPKPYYPRIVYGAVLAAEAHLGVGSFHQVEDYFAQLIAEKDDHLDANAYAGRANALMALERFGEALAAYQAAEPYLESPDSALLYNMIRARVLGGLGMDPDEIRRRRLALEGGLVTRSPGELARLTSSLCLANAYIGDTAAALTAWRDVGDLRAVFPEMVIDIAQQFHQLGLEHRNAAGPSSAECVITTYLERRPDLSDEELFPLRHLRARIVFDRGGRPEARRQLDALIERFPRTPVVRIDAAMFALADGDNARARRLCEVVVSWRDQTDCNPPLSSADFNLSLGQAFWLLGRRSESRECFRRSAYPESMWYGATMALEFGSLLRPGR